MKNVMAVVFGLALLMSPGIDNNKIKKQQHIQPMGLVSGGLEGDENEKI